MDNDKEEITWQGTVIGTVCYGERGWESFSYLTDFGHMGFETRDGAVLDLLDVHEEYLAVTIETLEMDLGHILRYSPISASRIAHIMVKIIKPNLPEKKEGTLYVYNGADEGLIRIRSSTGVVHYAEDLDLGYGRHEPECNSNSGGSILKDWSITKKPTTCKNCIKAVNRRFSKAH